MATAVAGTHPTGMHSCYDIFLQEWGGGMAPVDQLLLKNRSF